MAQGGVGGLVSSPNCLLWLTHSPMHTKVQFLEQPRLARGEAGPQELSLCNVRT